MTNDFRTLEAHSAEYFGDTRDYWWNPDYIELTGRRLSFDKVRDVLDVGCGVGHWAQVLAPALPVEAKVIGVDRDPFWIEKANERAVTRGIYLIGFNTDCRRHKHCRSPMQASISSRARHC